MREICRSGAVKVIDITEFYSERGGGIRSHLTTKGHVLCQRGHGLTVVAPGARDDEATVERSADGRGSTRVIRVAGPTMPYDPTYHLLTRLDKIRALVRREKPDVLEVHSPYLAAAAALACGRQAARVRTLFWHSDHVDTYARPMLTRALASLAPSKEERAASRLADGVLSPAWAGLAAIANRFDATLAAGRTQVDKLRAHGVRDVRHVPFGVDVSVFTPAARSAGRRRELAGEPAFARGAAVVVAGGRFAIEKRWDVLIDAFCKLRAGGVDAVLAVFGDGPESARMRARAAGRDDIRFFGFEQDRARLASAFASADVFAHACPYETFGLTIAEAMACGLPVVVPDQGGACESLDRATSVVYRSLDVNALTAAMATMLARDRTPLRAAAEAAGRGVLSIEQHFDRLLAVYEELLQARAPR